MPEQIKSDVKLTNNRDANIDSILDKSKNLKWAYNDLGILINDLSNIPEKDRVKKYGIKNSDIEAFKEIRLGVVMHVQKTDPKGIGPDKFYYGSDKAALAKVDTKFRAERAVDNARLGAINTQTPSQKASGLVQGFGQGLTLNTRAAAFEKFGLPGTRALQGVDPDDPFKSSGLRLGASYGKEYASNAAGIPGTLFGGGAAGAAVGLLGRALPQTRVAQGIIGLGQGIASMVGGAKGGEFTAGLADQFDPFNRLRPETQEAITQRTAGPEKTLGSAAAQMTLFSPFSRNASGQISLLEGQGLYKSARNMFRGGPQPFNSEVFETGLDVAGRVGDALSSNDSTNEFNKGVEQRLTQRLGRTPTRQELIDNGFITPEEQQINLGLSLGLGGYTKHGSLFTGQHLFNRAQEGFNTLQDQVVKRSQASQIPTTPVAPAPVAPSAPKIDTGGMFKFNVNIPGLNQQPASQARISFDPNPKRKTATVEPRVDRIPDQWRNPAAKTLRERVGLVNGTLITGISQDGDFFTQTQQLDGSYKLETKSYQELPDALKQKVKETLYQTKVDGKSIDADATFDPASGYKSEYNTNLDAASVYQSQFPAKVEINGREVNAAIVEKVGTANVRVQLPSGNNLVVPNTMVSGDLNVTGVRTAKTPRLSTIKDGFGKPVAYEDQGIDFFIPPAKAIRESVAATPGSWKDLFKMDRGLWEDISSNELKDGTVVQLENLGKGKDIWGIVLRPEEFSLDGEEAFGWRVQPLHDPRAAQVIIENRGISVVDVNAPNVIEDAVESGELDPSMVDQIEGLQPEQEVEEPAGTPVNVIQTPSDSTETRPGNVTPAVVQTSTTGGAGTVDATNESEEPNPFAVTPDTSSAGAAPTSGTTAARPPAGAGRPVSQASEQPSVKPTDQPTARVEAQPEQSATGTSQPPSEAGRTPRIGDASATTIQPEDYNFKFGEEFKREIPDENLPPEMRKANRVNNAGQVNAYRGMTKGEEVQRPGSIYGVIPFHGLNQDGPLTRLTSVFKLNVKSGDTTKTWDIDVKGASVNGKFGQAEFKQLLISEWGQTEKQAEALSKYVDRWAVGWAKEIARLSGYNVNTVARALRIEKDPRPDRDLEDWEAFKATYREQQVLNPTEANKKLIGKLVGVFYAQRLGGIAGLTVDQRVSLGRPGGTFTLQGNNRQVMHVALAMRGKLNYVTQVHEVNHLLVRSLYGPMYHELAAALRSSYVISGRQAAGDRVITPDVEEQIVTSLTNAIFNSTDANKVITERFGEGGAGNDSTLTQMFNTIGSQMRESITPDTEELNNLTDFPSWSTAFDSKRSYAVKTPIIYQAAADKFYQAYTASDYNPTTGDKRVKITYESDGKENTILVDTNAVHIGEVSVTKLPPNAQAIVAKWLGHWYDWTSSQIEQYVPDITFKNFEPITVQEIVRRNVGYQWWANVEEYKASAQVAGADSFSNKRIRRRNTFSYLGWLDQPNLTGQGYNAYLSYGDLQQLESPALFTQTDKSLVIKVDDKTTELSPSLLKLIAKETEEANKIIKAAEEAAKPEVPTAEASTSRTTTRITPGTVRAGVDRPTDPAALSQWIVLHENMEIEPPVGDSIYDRTQTLLEVTNYAASPKAFIKKAIENDLGPSDVVEAVNNHSLIKQGFDQLKNGIDSDVPDLIQNFNFSIGREMYSYASEMDTTILGGPALSKKEKEYKDILQKDAKGYIEQAKGTVPAEIKLVKHADLSDKLNALAGKASGLQKSLAAIVSPRDNVLSVGVTRIDLDNDTWVMPSIYSRRNNTKIELAKIVTYLISNKKDILSMQATIDSGKLTPEMANTYAYVKGEVESIYDSLVDQMSALYKDLNKIEEYGSASNRLKLQQDIMDTALRAADLAESFSLLSKSVTNKTGLNDAIAKELRYFATEADSLTPAQLKKKLDDWVDGTKVIIETSSDDVVAAIAEGKDVLARTLFEASMTTIKERIRLADQTGGASAVSQVNSIRDMMEAYGDTILKKIEDATEAAKKDAERLSRITLDVLKSDAEINFNEDIGDMTAEEEDIFGGGSGFSGMSNMLVKADNIATESKSEKAFREQFQKDIDNLLETPLLRVGKKGARNLVDPTIYENNIDKLINSIAGADLTYAYANVRIRDAAIYHNELSGFYVKSESKRSAYESTQQATMRSYVVSNIRQRVMSLMRSVYIDNGKMYMQIRQGSYLQSAEIDATTLYKEVKRSISNATQSAVNEYVQHEIGADKGSQNRLTTFLRRSGGGFGDAVNLAVSSQLYGSWSRYKPENRKYIDVKSLDSKSSGLPENVVQALRKVKTTSDLVEAIRTYEEDMRLSPLFAHHVEMINKYGESFIKGTEIPLLKWSDAQIKRVETEFIELEKFNQKSISLSATDTFIEPAAKASGSMEKLMQRNPDDNSGDDFTETKREVFEVAKSLLTSPDYYRDMIDDFINKQELLTKPQYTLAALIEKESDVIRLIANYKEDLAFWKSQDNQEAKVAEFTEAVQIAQRAKDNYTGAILNKRNKAGDSCRQQIDAMDKMFDILSDITDAEIYKFFAPEDQLLKQKTLWMSKITPDGVPNLYRVLQSDAKLPLQMQLTESPIIDALREYDFADVFEYRDVANALANVSKMFDRALDTYDRSREIITKGNLTPRYVGFMGTIPVKDASILDARRVNLQTFKLGSSDALTSEQIQAFVGVGSATYKGILYGTPEQKKSNEEIRQAFLAEHGQRPTKRQLLDRGYEEPLIQKMSRYEEDALLKQNNPRFDESTVKRHTGLFREMFAYLNQTMTVGRGDNAKQITIGKYLFDDPDTFTTGEKIWMALDKVEFNAFSEKEDPVISELRTILRRNLQVTEGNVKQRIAGQSKNLRMFRKHVADSMIMPIQRDYVGTRPGGLVEVTTTTPKETKAFAEAVFRHVLQNDKISVLNPEVYTSRNFYRTFVQRINRAVAASSDAKRDIGSTRTVLSDAELMAIAESYDREGDAYEMHEKYAFVQYMIEKRDDAIRTPLNSWLKGRQETRQQLTINGLNDYLNHSGDFSETDKKAFIGLFINSLSANKSQLKRYVTLTGHLPNPSELADVAKTIDVPLDQLKSEYEAVEKLVLSVGLDALSNQVAGSSVKITHYNRSVASIATHGVFVDINPSDLQGQNAYARSTWVDLENILGPDMNDVIEASTTVGAYDDIVSKQPGLVKSGVLATTLTDMVWGKTVGRESYPGGELRPASVSTSMPAPNKNVTGVTSKQAATMTPERRLAMHIHNSSAESLKTVLNTVLQDMPLKTINESLRKFRVTEFLKTYTLPSKAMPDRVGTYKAFADEFARNVLAARQEMVRSVNDTSYDSYEYTVASDSKGTRDYSSVTVYDRMLGRNVYEIDYVNGRVFTIDSKGKKTRTMPVAVNSDGVTALHVKMADLIFQGSSPAQRKAYEAQVYQSMVNSPLLNPVPAVFWHGRYRILDPGNMSISEPMFMSNAMVNAKDIYNSVGSFDPITEDAYIKPVLDSWTMPDATGNTRVRVDETGLPFFDGYGYTVTTAEGHRSALFTNLIANGLSKEKALSIYAMTEHPSFKNWMSGDLVENVALRKATSFVDQGRVIDAPTYNKVNKVIAFHEFIRAVNKYMESPSTENLDRVEFTYDETELGRHLTDSQLKAKAKAIVATELDSLAYIKTANDLATSMTTEDIAFHVNPYLANREGEKQLTTGKPFTSLMFEDSSNTFMNMDAPGLRTFDLGSGLTGNGARVNQPYFVRMDNPYVHDAVENGIAWNDMQDLMKKVIRDGHDGLVVTNLRSNFLTSERKNLVYSFNDSNIKPIDEMGTTSYTQPVFVTEDIVTPMFMNAPMYAPVTAKVIPAASSAVFVQPPKTGKEIAGDVVGYAGDVVQGIARFPLSLDFAFVGIQGAKALLGLVTGRPYDTFIALKAFGASMQGMMPNSSITIFGKKIGFDKLGRRAWLKVYEEMRKDPYFQLMRDLNVPLHFVNFEKNVETKRRQVFQESGGKIKYDDIKLDMLDFDERGNMTDYFERITPTTWIPLTGMFERQMSLNHDLLLFNQIKYQLQHNPMFKGLNNDQLAKRRDVKALVNFLAMSVGDVQYSTNDKYDAAAGRWGKFIAAAPRWYLSNVLMNPIINPAVTALYKAVPSIRKALGENYRGVGLYDYNLTENRALLAYQMKTFVGTAAFTALMPMLAELLGRLFGREDITGEQGIGKYRFGDWKMADSSGVWDFWNTTLTTLDRATQGTFQPLPKPGDKRSTADWLQQVSTPTLYKVSPVITKLIQTVSGVDVIGRPVYTTDHEWLRWYQGFFQPLVKKSTGVDLGYNPMVKSLFTTSLSPTSWSSMYKTYYEADWRTEGTMPEYAADQSIKQFVASALGTRADYDQAVPQAFQGKYRLMQKMKRLHHTGPSMLEILNNPDMNLAPRMITGEDKF